MPTTPISSKTNHPGSLAAKQNSRNQDFGEILSKSQEAQEALKNSDDQQVMSQKLLELGTISTKTPTVSHIFKDNDSFDGNYWNIIYSSSNKNKKYNQMSPGTKVYMDTTTKELRWSKSPSVDLEDRQKNNTESISHNTKIANSIKEDIPHNESTEQLVNLGEISKQNPTVSHLFKNNPAITGNYWNIIFSPINSDKPFTNLLPGTQISINTANNEIIINNQEDKQNIAAVPPPPVEMPIEENNMFSSSTEKDSFNMSFSEKLANSLKPLIGRPYKEMDCYGLVVRGLIQQGINYQGSGGLRQSLESAAKFNGLPGNAYLTGEGLVQNTGTTLYEKTFNKIYNSQKQSHEIYNDINEKLEPGLILSFSTPSRGHTGVVARQDKFWTYINSGLIDNNVNTSARISRKVGEEILSKEITNWCKLAKERKEPLKVTMGKLDELKLKQFSSNKSQIDLSQL